MFEGKRTSRFRVPKQIRADEEMVKAIYRLADEDCRDPNREILYLLTLGIKARLVRASHDDVGEEKTA
jgi:hypothetical protein